MLSEFNKRTNQYIITVDKFEMLHCGCCKKEIRVLRGNSDVLRLIFCPFNGLIYHRKCFIAVRDVGIVGKTYLVPTIHAIGIGAHSDYAVQEIIIK